MSRPSFSADPDPGSTDALQRRIAELEARLAESEETLEAIRSGEVDAVVVGDADQRRVFTLESADRPYRLLIEEMREGAVTLSADGVLLYCNHAFAELVGAPASQVVGARLRQFILESREPLDPLFEAGGRTEIVLRTAGGERRPASLSLSPLPTDEGRLMCGVVADLTESRAHARDLADARQDLAVAVAKQEGDERYRALFEAIDTGFCVFEVLFDEHGKAIDYRFDEANPAFEQQTGLANVVGRRMRELAPDHEERWFEHYGRVALTGESLRIEDEAAALGRWYDINAFRTGPPERRRVAVLFNDITARRKVEAELRESEARLRFALKAGRFGAWTLDVVTGELTTSDTCRTNFGRAPDKPFTYADLRGDVHPDDRARMTAAVEASLATGTDYDIEYRVVTSQNDVRWVLIRAQPSYDPTGVPITMTGISIDVTDRKRAEERLRELNETLEQQIAERTQEAKLAAARLQSVYDTSSQLMSFLETDGTLLSSNRAALEVINASVKDVVGLPFWDTPWFSETPGMPDLVREGVAAAARGELVEAEIALNLPGGAVKIYDFAMRPVCDASGNVVQIVPEATDITAQRRTEEALRQSQKMEAMGQLTGGVAHDFNNLLTPIIGSLDMLQRRAIGGEREQRLISGALQSADRAKTLVQRLLAFARRQPLKATAVDLGALLDGMGELVASTSGPQINIVVKTSRNVARANADLNQLEMAILNLAVNARDAMPDGGTLTLSARDVRIEEGHRSKLSPGPYVELSVADTGTGMDEATMMRAVEPFFSTKGVGKGTGLGLSMVHGLASQLGGAMTLASEPGLGTKVELWLPVSAGPVEAESTSASIPPEARGAGLVLLVDDEAIVRTSTADMLSELGYEVVEAGSASEALKLLEGGLKADLLLTDHLMPGMTGTELARETRERWPDCPVLLISGFADTEGVAPDLPRLTKPFRQAELAAMLTSVS